MSDALDELLAQMCGLPLDRYLADCPREVPLPAQVAIVTEARRRVEQRHGLRLPKGITVRWVNGARDRGLQHGEIHYERGGVAIYFRADLFPEDLALVALHELKHAADAGLIAAGAYRSAEFERRAIDFSNLGMGSWPWLR